MSLAKDIVAGEICAWCTIPFEIGGNLSVEQEVMDYENGDQEELPTILQFEGKAMGMPCVCEDCAALY